MAIQKLHNHPEIILRQDAILCSINERLGGHPGQDFKPLTLDFILDAVDLHLQEAKLLEEKDDDRQKQNEYKDEEINWREFKL